VKRSGKLQGLGYLPVFVKINGLMEHHPISDDAAWGIVQGSFGYSAKHAHTAIVVCRGAIVQSGSLQAVAFSPFSRIWTTAAFRSPCEGDFVSSHLKLCLYHSSADGETFERN
jgi:hypothetical protein